MDQLVRGAGPISWQRRGDVLHTPIVPLRKSLRQKGNLVSFVRMFAERFGIEWAVEASEGLGGGLVRVIVGNLDPIEVVHIKASAQRLGNIGYDVLCLVPSSSTKVVMGRKQFSDASSWRRSGLELWDGTSSEERRLRFSMSNEAIRLLPYESARGLEGWSVVCLSMDAFWERVLTHHRKDGSRLFEVDAPEAEAARWAMIAFTRAIDTLVINVRDETSALAVELRELARRAPDYVVWEDVRDVG
jgi:hypothetical protein